MIVLYADAAAVERISGEKGYGSLSLLLDDTSPDVAAETVESVRRWMRQADVDDGIKDGLTTAEQNELVQLRRRARQLEIENEILRRAAAYFAKDALPK